MPPDARFVSSPLTPSTYISTKTTLIDQTVLIIGSQNLSTTSLLENRKLSLLLNTQTAANPVIGAVASTFDSDYRQAAS
ncbi:hypothetical protein MAHJHV55_27620 [Mycobacterium avium subsp. hominissuis]